MFGASAQDRIGLGFAFGDFDGDDQPDLAVLARGTEASNGRALVYLLWGAESFPDTIDFSNFGDRSLIRAGEGEMGWLARICAADFNGDGIDDIALGIPCMYPFANCDGKVYVVLGRPEFPETLDLTPSVPGLTTFFGSPGRDGALGRMMVAADMNGDQIDDLVIAAPQSTAGSEVYIFYGNAQMPFQVHLAYDCPYLTRIIDSRPYQSSGKGLAVGKVNGDQLPDLLIGSPGEGQDNGEATLLFGSILMPDTVSLASQPPNSIRFVAPGPTDQMGYRVGIVDFNRDSYGDLVLSSYTATPNGCSCGEVDVVLGSPSLPNTVFVGTTPVPTLRLLGSGELTLYGTEMACGDVNGDGFGDVLIMSKPDLSDLSDLGRVTIVYGTYSMPGSISLASDPGVTRIHGENRNDGFGYGLAVYDVSADGVKDVVIGAPNATAMGKSLAGKAYVLHGTPWTTGVETPLSQELVLGHNVPNPFNPATRMSVVLSNDADVHIAIYDVHGTLVRDLLNTHMSRGSHWIYWDGTNSSGNAVASGVYFCRATAGSYSAVRKLNLLK